jgi:hypothetical protein
MADYNGQTKKEYQKNFQRIKDIIDKTGGDREHAIRLAQKQANAITDEHKAINRSKAAVDLGHEWLADPFFERAYELGVVDKMEYREYKLKKLFEMQNEGN